MRAPLQENDGSVTLVALCFTSVLAIALTSYLSLYQRAYDLGTREMQANKARQLAQSGLEEALWAMNQNVWTGSGPAGNTAWTTAGADRTVVLSFGSLGQGATGVVSLKVANFASAGPTWPAITSTATVTLEDGRVFTRTLQAATGPAPLFGNAIGSTGSYVRFSAGGTVDSWNSDPANTNAFAPYSFLATAPANYAAVIAATDTNNDYDGTNAVVINQAQIFGYLATSGKTAAYAAAGSPPGRVKGPVDAGVNIDPARVGKSAFIPGSEVFTITPPATSGSAYGGLITSVLDLVAALLGGSSTQEVYKYSGNLVITGNILFAPSLTVSRPIKLIVDGDILISGAGKITVTSTGSLQIFAAHSITLGGAGIDNQTDDPRKVALFATSASGDTVQSTTNADFCGVIYSENSPIEIRQNATLTGALLSGESVTFLAGATDPVFHYDLALRRARFANVATPYIITSVAGS